MIDEEDFNFEDTGISENEYYELLEDIKSTDYVKGVTHALVLNEINMHIPSYYSGDVSTDYDDLYIEYAGDDEFQGNESVCVTISTTKKLCNDSELGDVYHAEYCDEAMVFLYCQLELFDAVESCKIRRNQDGRLTVSVDVNDIENTFLFNEIMTYCGYLIETLTIENGDIREIEFGFKETRAFNDEAIDSFQKSKTRRYQNVSFDNSDITQLPCGHLRSPTIMSVSKIKDDDLQYFESVEIDNHKYNRIPIREESIDNFFLEVSDYPNDVNPVNSENNSISAVIERGYLCDICNIAYLADNIEEIRRDYTDLFDKELKTVEVEGDKYTFSILTAPFLPSEYID